MFYVYLLKSLKDNKYYIGQTQNVEKRLKAHNSGLVQSTKPRRPLVLIGYETFDSRNEARWFEYNLKNHSDRKKKFIKQIESYGFRPLGQ
jgi:putative endonuclease